MKYTITCNLTQKDIKKLIGNLKDFKEKAQPILNSALEELRDIGVAEIESSLNGSDFSASEPVSVLNEKDGNRYRIGIKGAQALYEEYGTGTVGAMNPHPQKDASLNPYNSGKTIRINSNPKGVATKNGIPLNTLYWTYKYNGTTIYTQGRPAGAHVFKASRKIRQNSKKIIKEKVGEALSKL